MAISARELERALAARDAVLGALGHDLRSALGPIATALDLLARTTVEPGLQTDLVALGRRQVLVLLELVDEISEIATVLRGPGRLVADRVDLVGVVDAAIRMCPSDDRDRVLLEPAPVSLPLNADGPRLARAFQRLIAHACANTDFGESVRVSTGRVTAGPTIEVRYRPAPTQRAMPRDAFDPFRGETATRLQLASLRPWLARQVIEQHGGSLRLEYLGSEHAIRAQLPAGMTEAETEA